MYWQARVFVLVFVTGYRHPVSSSGHPGRTEQAGSETELREFKKAAADYRSEVAQGCAFAATARVHAGLVVPHTELATQVICGITPEQAAKVCENALPAQVLAGPPESGELPAYEVWRQRIAAELMSLGTS